MCWNKKNNILTFIFLLTSNWALAQFAPPPSNEGTTAIKNNSSSIIGWATSCSVERGWKNIADTSLGKVSFGDENNGIGASNPAVVSLGDGGIAILTFDEPLKNREGFDFAVFENGFDDFFLELAHVEVSTDGIHYVRFPSISNTQNNTQIDPFGTLKTEKIHNLAGKYKAQYGTPFDLNELKDSSTINIDNINYVKIIDVIGSINPENGSFDNQGNIINDPYPTDFENGGFDLDAVAVIDESIINSITNSTIKYHKPHPNPVEKGNLIYVSENGILMDITGNTI